MTEVSALQTPFCLRCESLLLADQKCASCGWERPNQLAKEGDIAWKLSLDGDFAKPYHLPAIHGNLLVACIENGRKQEGRLARLVAINLTSGDVAWSQELQPGCVARFLCLANDTLLVGSENLLTLAQDKNYLLALDPGTGKQRWSYEVATHSLSTPAVVENIVFFTTSDKDGYALDLLTGQQRWQSKDIATSWSSIPPTAGDEAFYLGGRTATIKRISLDGTVSQIFHVDQEQDWFDLPLTYAGGVLYALCRNKQLYAIDTVNHSLKWSTEVARGATAPPVVGRYVFVPLKDHPSRTYSLRAISPETGDTLWQFNTQRHFEAPASTTDAVVFIGGNDGNFYALDWQTGDPLWRIEVQDKVRTVPIIAGNHVCFGTEHGTLYVIRWREDDPQELLAADQHRDLEQWSLAGTAAILAGDWLGAARDFERAGEYYKAAQLYERAEAWADAARLYLQRASYAQAAELYHYLNDKQGEADALLGMQHFERAAGLYSELGLHERAAEIYRDAGHLNRAAAQFDCAGQFDQAAEIYKELGRFKSAAKMYEKAGKDDLAVDIWLQLDESHEAARVLEKAKQYGRAAHLLESKGDVDDAATLWLRQNAVVEAADVYRRAKRWLQAAELYESANEREQAARLYVQGGKLQRAARLFLANLQFSKAADLFLQAQDAISAAKAYESEGNWRRAAQLYRSATPPQYGNAGRCYEQLQAWQEAASAYEDGGLFEDAIRCWLADNNVKRAAHLLHQTGNTLKAAQLLEEAAELVESAEMYLKNGSLSDAARLYRRTGNEEHALELLAQHEAWDEYRELAVALQRYEREAEACVALAKQSSRTEAYKLYRAAAQAYERAAQQYEEENTPTRTGEEIAELWFEAAKYYGMVDSSDERIAECKRQARRLRKLPEIVIEVKAQKELIVNEWHRLLVRVKNVGYGYAFDIAFKVTNNEFEGDMQFTQDIVKSLPPDEMKQTLFSVKPKTPGSSVPMKILLAYHCPDGTRTERVIATDVPVHQTSSKFQTPSRLAHRPFIDVYEDSDFHQSAVFILAKKIDAHYNNQELRFLAYSLSVEWENLVGTTRFEKAFALVEYIHHRNRLPELIERLEEDRPLAINWREGIDDPSNSIKPVA